MITASHNPKEYNGYKAYWDDGCQVSSEIADGMYERIKAVDIWSGVKKSDSNTANPIEEVNGAAMNKTVNSTNKTNNTTNITPKNTDTGNWLVIGLVVVVILILAIGAYVKFR